jgi:hypothetical protein
MFYAPKIIVKYSTVFLTVIENVHDCVQFGGTLFHVLVHLQFSLICYNNKENTK